MKNLQIKIVLVCLFSLVIVSTVNCNIFNQGEKDMSPDKSTISKGMVYVAINVGRVIGNTVFTMDDDLVINNPIKRIKGSRSRSLKYDDNERMAIAFGIVALIFLIINMYFGGKIVEFLKSKGRKAG